MENNELTYCAKCGRDLAKADFYIRNERVVYPCKDCKKQYYKEWKEGNKDYHKKWQVDNKEKCRAYNSKLRAKKKFETSV